jgi:hypothetical protein
MPLSETPSNFENMVINHVHTTAIRFLPEEYLFDIIFNWEDEDIRRIALEEMSDQETLAEIAVGDECVHMRRTAIENISDQEILADIAMYDRYDGVMRYILDSDRIVIVQKLSNKELLRHISLSAEGVDVRAVAAERLTKLEKKVEKS